MARTDKETALLGIGYLETEDFMKAVHHPVDHRPLPYTLADVQNYIERQIASGREPKQIFDDVCNGERAPDLREWRIRVNMSIIRAVEANNVAQESTKTEGPKFVLDRGIMGRRR